MRLMIPSIAVVHRFPSTPSTRQLPPTMLASSVAETMLVAMPHLPGVRKSSTSPCHRIGVPASHSCAPLTSSSPSLPSTTPAVAKIEFLGPSGSSKDRKAAEILAKVFDHPHPPKQLVVGCTGQFALSIAVCAGGRARTIAALPETTSNEQVALLKALGAEIARTPANAHPDAPESHTSTARRIAQHSRESVLIEETFDRHVYDTVLSEIVRQVPAVIHRDSVPVIKAVVAMVESVEDLDAFAGAIRQLIPGAKAVGVSIGTETKPVPLPNQPTDTEHWTVSKQHAYIHARQTMRESGHCCGVESGAVMAVATRLRDDGFCSDRGGDVVVVVLGDCARAYTNTLLNSEWLLENDIHDPQLEEKLGRKYRNASVEDLQLPEAICVYDTDTVSHAMDIMIARDFSQLPVVNGNRKVVGMVSLGRIQGDFKCGRLTDVGDVIRNWMYAFNRPRVTSTSTTSASHERATPFRIITPSTPLAELEPFFDRHSVAIVTDDSAKFPLAVVTKLDLLRFAAKRGAEF